MSGLFGLLNLGSTAFRANSFGVSVSGNNLANAGTAGYNRQDASLTANPYGGVFIGDVGRTDDPLLADRERESSGGLGYANGLHSALLPLDAALSSGDGTVVDGLAAFFGGLVDLSSSPLDSSVRSDAVSTAQETAATFARAAGSLQDSIDDTRARVRNLGAQASELTETIASLNEALRAEPNPTLADQRDLAARQLNELVGGHAIYDDNGDMRVLMGGGITLVDGDRGAELRGELDPTSGSMRFEVVRGTNVVNATNDVGGGEIGGLLAFLEGPAVDAQDRLDQLAFDFANEVNAVHAAGEAPDGTSGLDLFVAPAAVAGAAANLEVNQAIADDPSLLATVTPGQGPGDTGTLLAMIDLRDQPLAGGGVRTFVDEAIETISAVGVETQRASTALDVEVARADLLASLRDSLSGVSIEEEMARLSQLQRGAEAASNFVATVDEMLAHLIMAL